MTHAQDQKNLRKRKEDAGLVRIEVWVLEKWKPELVAKIKELIAEYKGS